MSLQFNDITNKNGLIQLCEQYTGLGDGQISGDTTLIKTFTVHLNNAYHQTILDVLQSQDDWDYDDTGTSDGTIGSYTTYPIGSTPMIAGQRDYTFPVSLKILKIKRVELTYNGVDYYKAEPLDINESGKGFSNDSTIDSQFQQSSPRYDPQANSIFIYPAPTAADVSASGKVKIWFVREINEFVSTDTTRTPGIDRPFQPLISLRASYSYLIANAPALAEGVFGQIEDLLEHLSTYYGKKDEDRNYRLKSENMNYN